METHDNFSASEGQDLHPGSAAPGRIVTDRLELKREWVQQAEERQVEEALNLYAQAARQRMQSAAPAEAPLNEEELEARSQELKLQQKCQEIAAQIMVDELEELDGEDE